MRPLNTVRSALHSVPAALRISTDPTCDMQITNVALDGTSVGRTVVKIHYIETSPYEDDSDFSDDDEEDDDEQDEDEDEDAADLKADKLDREPVGEERTIVLCSLYPQTVRSFLSSGLYIGLMSNTARASHGQLRAARRRGRGVHRRGPQVRCPISFSFT